MTDHHSDMQAEEYFGEAPISLSHFVNTIRKYAGVITISLLSIALAYLIVATTAYLLGARQKLLSVPFRLEFKGAAEGQYPNNLKFSVADITATPVLLNVYNADALGRFVSFDQFSRSIFVLESNRELERLTAEYATKLADPKLTPVDRDRIEREFEAKRASISKSDYAIQYLATGSSRIPNSVVNKALSDVLSTWARRAAIEKKVLDYQVAIISPMAIDSITVNDGDYLVPLLLLRQRVNEAVADAKSVEDVPGAKLVRIPSRRLSITDIRAHLDEILRFRLEPLISKAHRFGGTGASAADIVKAQLEYDQRALTEAEMRESALRNALLTYESENTVPRDVTAASVNRPAASDNAAAGRAGAGETVMPQLSDTFIDRIVDLTTRTGDREYRQKLTDDIKKASLDVVPAQAAVKYDAELLASFQSAPTGGTGNAAALQAEWTAAVADARDTITNLNAIYSLASRQLYPETEMYRVTGPPVARIDHATSLSRLALYGVLVLLIALPLTIVFALLHNRVREEEAAEDEQSAERRAAATT